jgi:2-C-methyl-D-erythritol 2,4-cyclodiphosphate synthase
MRIGIGYDIHRFDDSRTLVLGGVRFEGERGLAGHSDADVLLHAVVDAVLGAAGLGDIGTHFPPGNQKWKDASSVALLKAATQMVLDAGFGVASLDSTVIAERPKLAGRLAEMRACIAGALGLGGSRVNVKAKTNEGIGEIGRGEAIAAIAVALLEEAT